MGTFAVGSIVCFFVGLAVRSMVRDKKNGKSIQCGGNCKIMWRIPDCWADGCLENRAVIMGIAGVIRNGGFREKYPSDYCGCQTCGTYDYLQKDPTVE